MIWIEFSINTNLLKNKKNYPGSKKWTNTGQGQISKQSSKHLINCFKQMLKSQPNNPLNSPVTVLSENKQS